MRLASFKADYRRLTEGEKALFIEAVRQMNAVYGRRGRQPLPHWTGGQRGKPVEGARGIWEMTWSLAGPDGRATFEIIDLQGEPAICWRRIGDHKILRAS